MSTTLAPVLVSTFRCGGPTAPLDALRVGVARPAASGRDGGSATADADVDVWLPLLAPSAKLEDAFARGEDGERALGERYRREMEAPGPRQVIELLACVASRTAVAVGCTCADERRCHRGLLAEMIRDAASGLVSERSRTAAWDAALSRCGNIERWEALARVRDLVGDARAATISLRYGTPPTGAPAAAVCSIEVSTGTASQPVAVGATWEEALERLRDALAAGQLDREIEAVPQESRMVDEGGPVHPAEPPAQV